MPARVSGASAEEGSKFFEPSCNTITYRITLKNPMGVAKHSCNMHYFLISHLHIKLADILGQRVDESRVRREGYPVPAEGAIW